MYQILLTWRKNFFKNNIDYIVVKNTLLKIPPEKNDFNLSTDIYSGSTAIALSYDEPVAAAKIIKDFLKDHDLPKVKGILFEGSYLGFEEFDKIASLPSKDESLTKLVIMIKSPIQNFVNVLNGTMLNLVNVQ